MKAALTTNGTQAMMVVRPSSLAAICANGLLCIKDMLSDMLEVQHVN